MDTAPTRESLGKKLRLARDESGVSRSWAAAQIGKSDDTLARYEDGRSEPTYRQVVILAGLYDRPIDWFVDGEAAA